MDIGVKEKNNFFGVYEFLNEINSRYSVYSMTRVELVLIPVNQFMNLLTKEELSFINSKLIAPFSEEELFEIYLENKYWEQFKDKYIAC